MDQLSQQRHKHKIAEGAAQEARKKFQAAASRVTQLKTQLDQVQGNYQRQTEAIKQQLFEAERDRDARRQEMDVANKMQADIAKTLTY